MYSRKSVGPRMEPLGAPALTGYSCSKDVPSRTMQRRLLLRKDELCQIISCKWLYTAYCPAYSTSSQ